METATQLGYVPHHAARRLARARAHSHATSFDQVGLIYLAGLDIHLDTICLEMMGGAEHELANLQASLTFVRIQDESDWNKVDRLTRAGGVDGWLIYGAVDDEVVNRLKPGKLPFVILGDHRCAQPVYAVNIDNHAVGRLAVQHLASLGHRRIAFLGSTGRYVYQQRTLEGFRAAVKELSLDDDERLTGNLSSWTDGVAKRLIDWLRNADPMPSAVFASEYDWAPWVHVMLKEARIEVPREISLLGYGIAASATRRENFTRIELPMTEVGRQGALLLHRVASESHVGSSEVKIPPSLIEGWSTSTPHTITRNQVTKD